jgi:hypothetical protein
MRVTSAAILLVYCTLLLPPLCFCINCPLERVALDLSDTPPPHPHPSSLWRGGGAAHPPDPNPPPPNTGGQLRSPWMGDENCVGGRCKRSSSPPQFSSPIHGLLTADRQCLGGGGLGSGGWATTPPPPRHKLEG